MGQDSCIRELWALVQRSNFCFVGLQGACQPHMHVNAQHVPHHPCGVHVIFGRIFIPMGVFQVYSFDDVLLRVQTFAVCILQWMQPQHCVGNKCCTDNFCHNTS